VASIYKPEMLKRWKPGGTGNCGGFSLIEVMIASLLVLLVFFGLAQVHAYGKGQLKMDENYRKATLLARSRMDDIRGTLTYDDLMSLDSVDSTYTIGGRDFTLSHDIQVDVPEDNAATIALTVSWNEVIKGNDVERTLSCESIIGRSVYWE
jgi:Tfp pilus assembly protein PilV